MIDEYDLNEVVNVSRQTTIATLQQAAQANEARLRVVRELEAKHPGFEAFYNSPAFAETLAARPKLGQAVLMAESDPTFIESHLPDLYSVLFHVYVGRQVQQGQQPRAIQQHPQSTQSESSFAATEQSKQQDISRNRRALIEELESKGIWDVDFDSVIKPSL
jgi:hypothetical protein